MSKKFRVVLVVLLVAVLGGFAWVVLQPREPVYHGQPLSFWLDEGRQGDWHGVEAAAAIRAMGSNALPRLMEMVQARDSGLRRAMLKFSAKQKWVPIPVREQQDIQTEAYYGFTVLGPVARPAVPALIHLLEDEDRQVQGLAAVCLGRIGPEARDAVPGLIKYLNSALKRNTGNKRDCYELEGAAFALGEIGAAAEPAIPQLTALSTLTNTIGDARCYAKAALIKIKGNPQLLLTDVIKDASDPSYWTEKGIVIFLLGTNAEAGIPFLLMALQATNNSVFKPRALQLLGRIHAQPEICLPVIIPLLQSTNVSVCENAVYCIREFGGFKKCLPAAEIARCLKDPNKFVRREATDAMRETERKAAERAAVK
ncbi:MAG: repeat-containing protein [Pedosphaera sp.]|nr:repeat-containing protein [Pedosphaera sp.]